MPSRKLKRAAGTRTAWDVLAAYFRKPKEEASEADIAAVDRGEGRQVSCFFRTLGGSSPERFHQMQLNLLPGRAELYPVWFSFDRKPARAEDVTSACIRPYDRATDRILKATARMPRVVQWNGGLRDNRMRNRPR